MRWQVPANSGSRHTSSKFPGKLSIMSAYQGRCLLGFRVSYQKCMMNGAAAWHGNSLSQQSCSHRGGQA